jgi:hypothetical protein
MALENGNFKPKTAVFFICEPFLRFLGGFKQQWDLRCCKKKPLTLLVLMKKYFLAIQSGPQENLGD